MSASAKLKIETDCISDDDILIKLARLMGLALSVTKLRQKLKLFKIEPEHHNYVTEIRMRESVTEDTNFNTRFKRKATLTPAEALRIFKSPQSRTAYIKMVRDITNDTE